MLVVPTPALSRRTRQFVYNPTHHGISIINGQEVYNLATTTINETKDTNTRAEFELLSATQVLTQHKRMCESTIDYVH
jgi:hypothetical protein